MSQPVELPFTSYEKMVESADGWGLDEAGFRAFKKTPWVVTEKIHGANFSLLTDGRDVRCAKRKEVLGEDDDFFGHRELLGRLRDHALVVFRSLKPEWKAAEEVTIYGELFGGAYPHPDVPAEPGVQPVQTGVYYSPRIEYCAFDITLWGKDLERTYLDYEQAMAVLKAAGFFFAKPLFIGKYEEAIQYPLGFDSHVPGWLGFPVLPQPNKAEGVVIKPLKSLLVRGKKGLFRPVLKRKIVEFAEDERFHQAQKWLQPASPHASFSIESLQQIAAALVNDARLASAISKVGRPRLHDAKSKQNVAEELASDALEQLREEVGPSLDELPEKERRALVEFVNVTASELVELYCAVES